MAGRVKLDRKSCENQAAKILSDAGVDKAPVRVDRIAKSHGIKVRYEPLDDELSGMIFLKDNLAVIGVNSRHSANRQRFTIAHELGHFFLHRDVLEKGAHVDKLITMLKRDPDAARGVVGIEIEANQFAAGLLMPKRLIMSYMDERGIDYGTVPDDDAIEEMALTFKVSATAMAFRMGTLF